MGKKRLTRELDCSRVKFRARARRSDRTILRTLPQRRLLVRGGFRRPLAESPTHRDLAGPLFVGNLSCVTCANRQHNLFLRTSERERAADIEALPQYGLTVADRAKSCRTPQNSCISQAVVGKGVSE